jgi:hypothetical protein
VEAGGVYAWAAVVRTANVTSNYPTVPVLSECVGSHYPPAPLSNDPNVLAVSKGVALALQSTPQHPYPGHDSNHNTNPNPDLHLTNHQHLLCGSYH